MQGKDAGLAVLAWNRTGGPRPVTTRAAELSEHHLARLAMAGDREAWGELVSRHDHRVVLSLLARGVRMARARELAHETWLRLIAQQRAGRLARLELPGLAIRQAAFLALDDTRRREEPSADEASLAALIDPAASVEERLISREQLRRAQAELERCSPSARRVFSAVYAEPGMPHAEAARRLGMSVQRVRQTLCEVRARLRAAIESEASHD
ncbi:MAG TPA: sigma-70 family RNA polymerase sigma factor [Kofleriaceae bacterium]|nr:sigma-70 family RNA polymerase sigma factor [Kofleriaceae bacterium]